MDRHQLLANVVEAMSVFVVTGAMNASAKCRAARWNRRKTP